MSGCVINSSSADMQRSRGTIGGGEPEYHPAPPPPRPITGQHQPIPWGTLAGGETSARQAEEWARAQAPPGLSQDSHQPQRSSWETQHHGSMGEVVWSTSQSEGYGAHYGMQARAFWDYTRFIMEQAREMRDKGIKEASNL